MLMKNYQLLHAVEKPLNFDFVKPFANTSDLKNFTPHIDENLAAEKMEQRLKKGDKTTSEDQSIDIDQKPKSKFETDEVKEKQEFAFTYQREATIGYLYRKMPYTYYVYKRIATEVQKRLPDFKPTTVLDFGAGLGSGVWAA